MMPIRRLTAGLILVSCATYGQEMLDDVAIGRLVRAGIGEQTVVTTINQRPGKYALSADDMITLKKAGVSDKILAAMIARNGAAPVSAGGGPTGPAAMVLHDATPIRLRLTRELTFSNVKAGDMVDFEIADDYRIDGLLVMAHGARATATITEAEPKTRMGRGGKLGVRLNSIPLVNGNQIPIRATSKPRSEHAKVAAAASEAIVKPEAPALLFTYARDESFPEGTAISVYTEGENKLDAAKFLIDIAFTSNPTGALVMIYGAPVGRTPFSTRLSPGTYKTVFSRDGYYDLSQSVTVGPGYSNTVTGAFELK